MMTGMGIQTNFSLKAYNTFGIEANAGHFASFSSERDLEALLDTAPFDKKAPLILGGGSNVLFTKNPEVVLKNEVTGIEKVFEDEDYVYVRAGGGERWHHFVLYCIEAGWAGIENLSLIPGNVGAGPMQNIGAYGAEIKDVFHSLDAFHLKDRALVNFSALDCAFGYRESVFKNRFRGQFAILQVTLRLSKVPHFNTTYGAIEHELESMGITELSLKAISEAVIRIRSSKLPDPEKIGNAGSFFKNPEIPVSLYGPLKERFPDLVAYPVPSGYKLAAGWLIEQCGWKGFREGDAGVHEKQALVLINYGKASGAEIYKLSEKVAASVLDRFGVRLEREVNVI